MKTTTKSASLARDRGAASLLGRANYVGVREAQTSLSRILRSHRPAVFTSHGKPLAACIPFGQLVDLLELVQDLEDRALADEVARARSEYRRTGGVPFR